MSDPMMIALMAAAWFAFMIPVCVRGWRRTPRQVDKELAKMVMPPGIRLDRGGDEWLRRQLVRRRRWSDMGTNIMLLMAVIALICLDDKQLAVEAWPAMQFPIAVVFGHSVGAALSSTRQAATGQRRLATLRPRSLSTYTRTPERILVHLHLGTATTTGVAAVMVSVTGAVAPATAAFLLVLSSGWLGALALVRSFRRRIMRTPPPIDDEGREIARELLVSIAVRDLLRMELLACIVVIMGALFYLPTLIDGFIPMLAVLPLYAAVGGIALARQNRRERGRPDLEWQFATTDRSVA